MKNNIEEEQRIIKLLKDAYGVKSEARARSLINVYKKKQFIWKISLVSLIPCLIDVLIPDPLPYIDEVLLAIPFCVLAHIHTNLAKELYAHDKNIDITEKANLVNTGQDESEKTSDEEQ